MKGRGWFGRSAVADADARAEGWGSGVVVKDGSVLNLELQDDLNIYIIYI